MGQGERLRYSDCSTIEEMLELMGQHYDLKRSLNLVERQKVGMFLQMAPYTLNLKKKWMSSFYWLLVYIFWRNVKATGMNSTNNRRRRISPRAIIAAGLYMIQGQIQMLEAAERALKAKEEKESQPYEEH